LRAGAVNDELVLVVALTVAGAALRFSTLDVQSFWHDEAVTAHRIIRHSLFATIGKVPGSESTPPLYYMLAWLWTRVFGISEPGLRSLSALIGTATVPVAYRAARTLAPRRAPAVATAALAAVSPVLVWYSQEARAYILLVLLGALSFLFFLRALRGGERRDLAWWAVVSALALCAHYFAVFVVLPEVAWLLRSRVRGARPAVGVVALVGAALLPLAIHQANQGHTSWISSIPLKTRVGDLLKEFVIGPSGSPTVALSVVAGLLVGLALVLLAVRGGERERLDARPPLIVGGVAILLPLALAIVSLDYFFPRNLIAAWLPLATLVGLGCGLAAARRIGALTAAVLCCTLLAITISVNFNDRLQRPDWRGVAHALGPAHVARAIVVPHTGDDPLEYYMPAAAHLVRRHATVSEVDLVGWPLAGKRPPTLSGFGLFRSERVSTFTIYRYRSAQPRLVPRTTLVRHHLGTDPSVAMIQGGV
jgi:4-amino-4-deoxy-L-arabinose transferase-like glycosyltransferase